MKTWVMKDTQIQVSDKGLVEIQNEHLKKKLEHLQKHLDSLKILILPFTCTLRDHKSSFPTDVSEKIQRKTFF